MKKFDYETIDPGYYHRAMLHGNRVQRFWHTWKFVIAAEKIPREKVRVVDIGCGPGSFFYVLRKKNSDAMLFGTDLMLKQLEFAKTIAHGTHWFVSDATKMPLKTKSIDIATMLEIIEHLPPEEEHQILEQVHKSLAKNGRIIITTPNYRSLWPVIEWFWNIMSPISYKHQHINKKTIKKMKASLKNAGFGTVNVKTFFILSPFVSFISPKLAAWLLRVEQKLFPRMGAIIIAEASA
jgi:2-polyprenyl-3-methyl-5-hydroxy-6-metoxy-1,4-benzoquinol methylase